MDSIIKVKEGWIETAQREISFKNFMTADITTPKQCFLTDCNTYCIVLQCNNTAKHTY